MALTFPNIRPEVFPPVGPFHIGSWTIGPLAIRWYALAYIAGILLGWRYATSMVRNAKLWGGRGPTLTVPQVDDLILWITLGVILGGRIGYILFYMLPLASGRELLMQDPLTVFKVWQGGMSFHGGAIGVLVAGVLFGRANKIDLMRLGDLVVACEPIGQFFGRVANFINGELWGRHTDLPWGMVFCNDTIMAANNGLCPAGTEPRHPSQLYEAGLEGIALFLILWWVTHRAGWLQRRGAVTGLFLVGYGVFRIVLETVRNPDPGLEHLPLGLTVGIMLSVPMVLLGAWLIVRGLKEPPAAAPSAGEHEPA
ncbi:MAG TPA: prolipoprotein diacylglyceryl transferase [Caulobacteraceae bacterium]|nr:prolipoprotein diacylglyceryl transferase [Caulobacteraceae bacterium]